MRGQQHAPAALYSGEKAVSILQEARWAPGSGRTKKSRPHRDSIPNRPASNQSLYRLSYSAHTIQYLQSQKVQVVLAFQKLKITVANRQASNTTLFSKARGFDFPRPLLLSSFRKCGFSYQPSVLSMAQTLTLPAVESYQLVRFINKSRAAKLHPFAIHFMESKQIFLFRRFRITTKSDCQLRYVSPPVRLTVWNNSAPTGRIFMKFHI